MWVVVVVVVVGGVGVVVVVVVGVVGRVVDSQGAHRRPQPVARYLRFRSNRKSRLIR
jgi:hypothetical protein